MKISILFLIIFCSSCSYGTTSWYFRPQPPQATIEDEIEVSIVALDCGISGCKSIGLQIENNSDRDLQIDWNKTLFIENGLTNGGFFFKGIPARDRNENKPPDVVFANSLFLKIIHPSVNVYYNDDWYLGVMGKGVYGIYLSMLDSKNVINEKIIVYLYAEQ
ncbi:MAG: hypothetical protein ACRENO_01085 [Thermodesulfobacteriota bacterium]